MRPNFVFILADDLGYADERERANHGKRDPARLAAMRGRFADWEQSLPVYPDAGFSVIGTAAEMARPS